MRWLLGLLLLLPTLGQALTTHNLPTGQEEQQAVLGDFASGYVTSGCWLTAPASGLTLTLPPCHAYTVQRTGTRRLTYATEPTARSWTVPGSDGVWWLLWRWDLGATTGGTALPGTHYLWASGSLRPPVPDGMLLLAKVKATAGVVAVRNLWPTNPHTPGTIYGTDPAIGMVCDGVTDDTAALQRALDLSNQRSGTTVELPDGTCAVRNVVNVHQSEDPGGIDVNDARNGCADIVGQGANKTVLTGTAAMQPEDFILQSSCLPLGAGMGFPPYRFATGTTIRDLTFYGNAGRHKDFHGLIVEGAYVRLLNLNFHYLSGHALWVAKNIKQESGWYANIHVRHSGRYTVDNGQGQGLSGGGSSNNAAVLFDNPSRPEEEFFSSSNNISVYGLQLGYSWYSGLHLKCNPRFVGEVFFYGAMLHNNEPPSAATTNQGRLDDQAGLVNIDGPCMNINFHGVNAAVPGSDAAHPADTTAPPAPVFLIQDSTGIGGADMIVLSNVFLNTSTAGEGIRIKKARSVFLHNIRSGSSSTDFPRGQLIVEPGAFGTNGLLSACQILLHAPYVTMSYGDAGHLRECGRNAMSWLMTSDADNARGLSSGAWTMASGGTSTARAHGLACTPTAAQLTVTLTTPPGSCKELYLSPIDATTFTINCDTAPGVGLSGAWQAAVPRDCGSALYATPETPIFGSSRRYYIHGLWYIPTNPAPASSATDYATITLAKRKLLSQIPFAHVDNAVPFISYTPVAFTIDTAAHLVWEADEQIVLYTSKTGAGSALTAGQIVIQLGTEIPTTAAPLTPPLPPPPPP